MLARQNLFRVPPDPRPVTVLVSSPVLNMHMEAPILCMVSLSSPVLPRLMTCSMPFLSLWTTWLQLAGLLRTAASMAVLPLSPLRKVSSRLSALALSSGTLDVVTSMVLLRLLPRASRVTVYRMVWLALGTLLRLMTAMRLPQECVVLVMCLVRQRIIMVSALGLRVVMELTIWPRNAPLVKARSIPGPPECTWAFLFVVRTTVVSSVTPCSLPRRPLWEMLTLDGPAEDVLDPNVIVTAQTGPG